MFTSNNKKMSSIKDIKWISLPSINPNINSVNIPITIPIAISTTISTTTSFDDNKCPSCNFSGVGIYDGSGTVICSQCNLRWHYCKIHHQKVKRPAPTINQLPNHNNYKGYLQCSCISEWGSAFV